MFPEGVVYDREKDDYRTFKINAVIELIACQSMVFEEHKNGEADFLIKLPPLVRGRRLELLQFYPLASETSASTNFATRAKNRKQI